MGKTNQMQPVSEGVSEGDKALKTELLREVNSRFVELNESYEQLVSRSQELRSLLDGLKNAEDAEADQLFDLQMQYDAVQDEQRNVEARIASERLMLDKINLIGTENSKLPGTHQQSQKVAGRARTVPSPKKQMRAVPASAFANQQIDLFRDFLVNTDDEREGQSNAIAFWDSVPRYAISRAKQGELRVEGGFLPIAELVFKYKERTLVAEIRPARIKTTDKHGKPTTLEIYPSAREELIEHALRKLASEQQAGFLDAGSDFRSGLTFTLHQLRTELESRGHSLRYDELVEGLDVMNLSNIRLLDKGENEDDPGFVSQPYLPALVKVTKEGRANDPQAKWLVQFHSALTASIAQLTYRQFNYQRLMACKSQLSRWLLSQLVLKFTYASPGGDPFTMNYSTIQRDSRLLDNYKRTRDAIDSLDEAFGELKREGVLMNFTKKATTGARGKILEVVYTLAASVKFSSEQKAANRRQSNGREALKIVDNSQK